MSYEKFVKNNIKRKIRLLCSKLEPPVLKLEAIKSLDYDENLEKDMYRFIELIKKLALDCERFSDSPRGPSRVPYSTNPPS